MGIMLKGLSNWGWSRRAGNHVTSPNSSLHTDSSWRFKKLTEGAVTIGVTSLFQYFTARIEKDYFFSRAPARTLQSFQRMNPQARPHFFTWNFSKETHLK